MEGHEKLLVDLVNCSSNECILSVYEFEFVTLVACSKHTPLFEPTALKTHENNSSNVLENCSMPGE